MERRTRVWLGLGTAVLVSGTVVDRTVLAEPFTFARPPVTTGENPGAERGAELGAELGAERGAQWPGLDRNRIAGGPERLFAAQAEGGEGGAGEGGGQVLGTITEFRLSSTDPAAFGYDASVQVAAYAAHVHETYAAARDGAVMLRQAVGALLDAPSPDTLQAARAAWVEARPAYLRTEAFLFYAGPVDAPEGPLPRLNAWPVDPNHIEAIVADPAISTNFRSLARLNQTAGADKVTVGWHAIEVLLWGADGGRPAEAFVAGAGDNDRRREYLAAATQLLVNDLGLLVAAWEPGANNYRAAVEAMDQRNAIGRAFNGMTVLTGYELPLRRIGAGLFPANVDFQQSPYSDTSAADNLNAFEGARDVYFGSGFDALLEGTDPALAAEVAAAFDRAGTALAALDAPYARFLAPPAGSPERAAGEEAVRALTDLGRVLRQAGNRLGVLVVVPGI